MVEVREATDHAEPFQALSEHSDDLIESRIEVHDSNQIEVKLDYSIDSAREKNRYRIQTYFFLPESLGVSKQTYSAGHFYRDVQNYIRFKTPRLSLGALLDLQNGQSPLGRVIGGIDELGKGKDDAAILKRLDRELRILACLIRANLRDYFRGIIGHLANNGNSKEAFKGLEPSLIEFLVEVEHVLRRYRGIKEMLQGVSPLLIEAYEFVDEYISLTLESHLTQLLEKVNRTLGNEATAAAGHQKMRLILERERQHRDNVGYPRILESGVPNEHYVYRRGILKKFVMSVLFLEVKREKETHRVSDTVGAIAAGLAMVFAVATAVWAERRYGLNTGPFFGALVVSYILKDRIKEWVKRYSSRFLSRFTSDYRLEIMDPRNDRSVGVSRETFSFVNLVDIPDDVYSCRHGGAPNSIEARSKREICLKYEKEIILKGKIIDQHHGRLLDVNDIMRFKLGRLLDGADDPLSRVRLYNVKTRQIERVECPKVYHINVIFVLKADRGKEQYDTGLQARIICDRNGIRRLDLVTNHEKP